MHTIKVLAFGSENFNTSLEELKDYLNFKLTISSNNLESIDSEDYDVLFIHAEYLKENFDKKKEFLQKNKKIKILVSSFKDITQDIFNSSLLLPTNIKGINQIIKDSITKKNFNKNSKIKIKDYILDKNERKLIKNNKFVELTEKEIQLLELFLNNTLPIARKIILEEVWKYAPEADTHTVETHIYRLRKKINSQFSDENFILNEKDGYLI